MAVWFCVPTDESSRERWQLSIRLMPAVSVPVRTTAPPSMEDVDRVNVALPLRSWGALGTGEGKVNQRPDREGSHFCYDGEGTVVQQSQRATPAALWRLVRLPECRVGARTSSVIWLQKRSIAGRLCAS